MTGSTRPRKLPAGPVEDFDLGAHACKSRLAPGAQHTGLAHVHLHNKPFDMLPEHALLELHRGVDPSDPEALRCHVAPGLHLTRYFRINRAARSRSPPHPTS